MLTFLSACLLFAIFNVDGFRFPKSRRAALQSVYSTFNDNILLISTQEGMSKVTMSEWSIHFESIGNLQGKQRKDESIEYFASKLSEKDDPSSLKEMLEYNGDWNPLLNTFRRTIALRASEPYIRDPARNAQIFAALINLLIENREWKFARDLVDYVGIIPTSYSYIGKTEIHIDLPKIIDYITTRTLQIDIKHTAWVRGGRQGPEPVPVKTQVGEVDEWRPTGVFRPDLGFRICDMILAVVRLALRHVIEYRTIQSSFQQSNLEQSFVLPISIKLSTENDNKLEFLETGVNANYLDLQAAGIPVTEAFLQRCREVILEDISLLSHSFPEQQQLNIDNIYIDI